MRNEHIVVNFNTGNFECLHCGKTFKPSMLIPVYYFSELEKSFRFLHADCKKVEQCRIKDLKQLQTDIVW